MADPPNKPPPLPPRPGFVDGDCPAHDSRCRPGRCAVIQGEARFPRGLPRPEEPFVDLTADPAPDTVRTTGRVQAIPPPPPTLADPIEHRELVSALRQALAQAEGQAPASVSATPSVAPLSRRQQAARMTGKLAQWVTIGVGVLGIAAQVAAVFRPDLVGPIQTVIQLLGGSP